MAEPGTLQRRNLKFLLVVIAAVLILGACVFARQKSLSYDREISSALAGCKSETTSFGQDQCILKLIGAELRRGGVTPAMRVFSLAYEEFPSFANGGCHQWAHRVGDMTYFEVSKGDLTLDSLEFPQSTTACGYGFFHGFLEHYVQNQPDIPTVTHICTYLGDKLAGRMHDIVSICYHGAGHGFTLAQTAQLALNERGNIAALVTVPAQKCSELPEANAEDKEQCYEGIFNIVDEYMQAREYGLSYDKKAPFAVCSTQPAFLQKACTYEMAQQLDSASGQNAEVIEQLVSVIPNQTERELAFSVGITGIIQQYVDTGDGYDKALRSCVNLSSGYFYYCVRSIVGGLFEEGDPQLEYKKPLAFCEDPQVRVRNATLPCYISLALELPRFYTADRIAAICPQIPSAYRALCTSQITNPSTGITPASASP